MPDDITIIAIVFALILLLVFFSAVVLYLAFRVKETFRKETRRGSTIVKTAFLIGVLFLGGGLFYFFASSLTTINQNPPTPTATPTSSPSEPVPTATNPANSGTPSQPLTPTPSSNQTPIPTTSTTPLPTTTVPSPTPSSTPTQTPIQKVSFTASYPPSAKMNTSITITFTIINSAGINIQGAVVQTNGLLQEFTAQQSNYPIVGNAINVGALPPGTTIVSLQLGAPSRPVNFSGTVTLVYEDMLTPLTQQITISVRGN